MFGTKAIYYKLPPFCISLRYDMHTLNTSSPHLQQMVVSNAKIRSISGCNPIVTIMYCLPLHLQLDNQIDNFFTYTLRAWSLFSLCGTWSTPKKPQPVGVLLSFTKNYGVEFRAVLITAFFQTIIFLFK